MSDEPKLPNLDLIEETHTFPTMFTFKVIGDHHDEFIADVLNHATCAVGRHRELEHSVRRSAAGNHTSISLKVMCHTAHEVHGVYVELLKIKGLRALF